MINMQNEPELDNLANSTLKKSDFRTINSYLESYVPFSKNAITNDAESLVRPDTLETEVTTDDNITAEQFDHDMAMCRYYEGEE